jgi:uncharacterized protein YbaR (Trm112 family)
MERNYLCPICKGHLSVADHIVFLAKTSKKKKGLILLHAEIGNYESMKHPEFVYEKGEALEFFCPICHARLAADFDDNLAHVLLDEDKNMYDIYFSRIAGEKSTYQVKDDTVLYSGEHADRYTWFRMDDKYKRYLKR